VTLSRANYTDVIQLNITQRRRTSLRLIGKARRCRAAGVGSIPSRTSCVSHSEIYSCLAQLLYALSV
jgi:hypothetical protein